MADAKVEILFGSKGGVSGGGGGSAGKDPTGLLSPVQGMNDKLKSLVGPTAAVAGGIALLSEASTAFRSIFKSFTRLLMKLLKPIGDIIANLLGPLLRVLTPVINFIVGVFRGIDKAIKFLLGPFGGSGREKLEPQFAVTSAQETLPQFKTLQNSIDFSAGLVDEHGNKLKDFGETMDEIRESTKQVFEDMGVDVEATAKDVVGLGSYLAIFGSSMQGSTKWFDALNNIVSILTTGMTILERTIQEVKKDVLFGTPDEQQAALRRAVAAGLEPEDVNFQPQGTQGTLPSGYGQVPTTPGRAIPTSKIIPKKPKGILDIISDVSTGIWMNVAENLKGALDFLNPFGGLFGFQAGGIVPGRGPIPIMAHGGETVLPEGVAPVNVTMNLELSGGIDIEGIVDLVSLRLRDELTSRGV